MKRLFLILLTTVLSFSTINAEGYKPRFSLVGGASFLAGQNNYTALELQLGTLCQVNPWLVFGASGAFDMGLTSAAGTKTENIVRVPLTAQAYLFKRRQVVEVAPYIGVFPYYAFTAKNFGCGGQAGVDFRIFGFTIGGGYILPFNSNQKGAFAVHVGFAI